jgi:hypothetical protein
MPAVLILIGAVLLVSAYRNSQGQLATALESDVPPFLKWGLALGAVGALGFVPGMKVPSRYLLALVIVVLVLHNYTKIFAGFTSLSQATPAPSQAAVTPATQLATQPGSVVTASEISGSGGTAAAIKPSTAAAAVPFMLDALPQQFLTAFEEGIAGFGGLA